MFIFILFFIVISTTNTYADNTVVLEKAYADEHMFNKSVNTDKFKNFFSEYLLDTDIGIAFIKWEDKEIACVDELEYVPFISSKITNINISKDNHGYVIYDGLNLELSGSVGCGIVDVYQSESAYKLMPYGCEIFLSLPGNDCNRQKCNKNKCSWYSPVEIEDDEL